jgi:predicted transcriptional regulator
MIGSVEEEVDILDRHLQVLRTVKQNEPIGIVKTARELGYPHHKVRYSLRLLEEAELIEPTKQGAVTTDHADVFVETLNDDLNAAIERLHSMKLGGSEISD